MSTDRLLKIYCDNSSIFFLSKDNKYSKGTKHMDTKYFSIMEEVLKRRVLYIGIKIMIADMITMGLLPKTFVSHVEYMSLTYKFLLA